MENAKELENKSIVDEIPDSLPVLERTNRTITQVIKSGFHWDSLEGVIIKIEEETQEIKDELAKEHLENLQEEIGDLMWCVMTLCASCGFNCSETMDKAREKFVGRFRKVEKYYKGMGQKMTDVSLDELETTWQKMKRE